MKVIVSQEKLKKRNTKIIFTQNGNFRKGNKKTLLDGIRQVATIVARYAYHSSSDGRSRSARPSIESKERTELGNSRVGKNLATCVTPSSTAAMECWLRWFLDAISTSYIASPKTVL